MDCDTVCALAQRELEKAFQNRKNTMRLCRFCSAIGLFGVSGKPNTPDSATAYAAQIHHGQSAKRLRGGACYMPLMGKAQTMAAQARLCFDKIKTKRALKRFQRILSRLKRSISLF